MRTLLIALSSLLTLIAVIPYYTDIAKGRDKPRIATWLIWTILAFIAGTASLIDHQIPAGIFTLATAVECGIVVVLGLKHGDRAFEKLDIFCLAAAFISLLLLFIFKSPTISVAVVIFADFMGSLPTLKHCWQKPYEETLITYLLYVVSEIIILSIVDYKVFSSFAYPLYYLLVDSTLSLFILFSPYKTKIKKETVTASGAGISKSRNKLMHSSPNINSKTSLRSKALAPTGLEIEKQAGFINLRWNIYPEAISYSIYKNGRFLGSTPLNHFTDYYSSDALSSYYVKATDSKGTESAKSNTVNTERMSKGT